MLLCPHLLRDDCAFAGVFDGTVGFEASEYAQKHILAHLFATEVHPRSAPDALISYTGQPFRTLAFLDTERKGEEHNDALMISIQGALREVSAQPALVPAPHITHALCST
jgi:hypothetical protein